MPATVNFGANLNLAGNELQNVAMQNLAVAPSNPKVGQHYYNTADNLEYVWDGTSWVNIMSQGELLTFEAPLVKDNETGVISVNYDTVVGTNSNYLVTSGAVKTAINNALVGALKYQGTWVATSQSDYSSITLPVKKGYMYAVSGSATVLGVEWNAGDYLVINKDIAASGSITASDVDKIDNTEASDIVRLNATQTLTNKTLDADDNTVSNLEVDNFKSGVVVTIVGATGADTSIPTEQAVREAISALKMTVTNPALTSVGGVCTWTISSTPAECTVSIYNVSTGQMVLADVTQGSSSVTIKMNSSDDIVAGTYKAIIMG